MKKEEPNVQKIPISIEELFKYGNLEETDKNKVASAVVIALMKKNEEEEERVRQKNLPKPGLFSKVFN